MKHVFYHLLVFVCMASNASPFNNDSIQNWEPILKNEFKAYALGLKAKLGHKTIEAFTIQKAKKRRVIFYNNTWLYDFIIKEGATTRNIQLLSLDNETPIVLTNSNNWKEVLNQYPPQLNTEEAVLDFFVLLTKNLVVSPKDLPEELRMNLENTIHAPRIMFSSNDTVTIQSFIWEDGSVYLAIHKVDTTTKRIMAKGKSNLFLKESPSSDTVSFSKTTLLYNKLSWVHTTPLLSR